MLATAAFPLRCFYHSAVWSGTEMIIYDGAVNFGVPVAAGGAR